MGCIEARRLECDACLACIPPSVGVVDAEVVFRGQVLISILTFYTLTARELRGEPFPTAPCVSVPPYSLWPCDWASNLIEPKDSPLHPRLTS
jgi:hypothetical protein